MREIWIWDIIKVNVLPLLFKSLLHGQKDCVFQRAFKFTYCNETGLPSRKKNNHNNQTKNYRIITLFYLIRNKFMPVITYSPNFATPCFAARSNPNKPHTEQWNVKLLTFICLLFALSGWWLFLFPYTQSTQVCTA